MRVALVVELAELSVLVRPERGAVKRWESHDGDCTSGSTRNVAMAPGSRSRGARVHPRPCQDCKPWRGRVRPLAWCSQPSSRATLRAKPLVCDAMASTDESTQGKLEQ